MAEPFSYWLCIDFDPRPGEGTRFDSFAKASAAIRLRWPHAVLDEEWSADSDDPGEQGQFSSPAAVGERQEAIRFVYRDSGSKRAQDLVNQAHRICGILYRKPIKS